MSNIFRLFQEDKVENPAESKRQITTAVAEIVAAHAQLARRVKELSKQIDAVDHIIDALEETHIQKQLLPASQTSRESLICAMRQLSQHVSNLMVLRNDLVDDNMRSKQSVPTKRP